MNERRYGGTILCEDDGKVWLKQLCGIAAGFGGRDEGPLRARGLFVLTTDRGHYESERFESVENSFNETGARLVRKTPDDAIVVESCWTYSAATDVWSRRDILKNIGKSAVTVTRCLCRFVFSPGRYEVYSQASKACSENQGAWRMLDHGAIVLANEEGRSIQGGTPYACLREIGSRRAVAFHILSKGNWTIKIAAQTQTWLTAPFAVVELGLSDKNLRLVIAPGESIDLPEILAQSVPEGEPHRAAPLLHRYLLDHGFAPATTRPPMVYNTWFDAYDDLDAARLRRQLAVAKELGCEIFMIDAGWYGRGEGDWVCRAGDWREKDNALFFGRMRDFADEVRATGLGFGLWMEPERHSPDAPIVKEHPEWFKVANTLPYLYADLENGGAYAYMLSEICRLIETYRLAWIKLDSNFEFGDDRSEFLRYYEAWYRLLGDVRARHPGVFIEGCASGGMRSDLAMVEHVDGHFLSDDVQPFAVLRMYQGALLRLPPGRIVKFAVLCNVGNPMTAYGTKMADTPPSIVAPGGPIWNLGIVTSIRFVSLVAMPGVFCVRGNLLLLDGNQRAELKRYVDFYKQYRSIIAGSVAHLLTPPKSKDDRSGWSAIHLSHEASGAHLLFAYRLIDAAETKSFCLEELDRAASYTVTNGLEGDARTASGAELINDGIEVNLPKSCDAAVFVIEPVK